VTADDRDYLPDLVNRLQTADGASARRLLEEAGRTHPADPRPLLLLAAELVHDKELDRAEAAYTAALQCAPDFAIARFQLGLLQLTSGRPAVAQATWAPLELLEDGHPLRLFKTGLELLAQDRFAEARGFLERGIAANHENPPLNRDMQMVLEGIGRLEADAGEPPASSDSATEGHVLVSSYRNTR
jgi:tetratricopeptide (TPR) repeat protein